jgi:hypothetical protein
MFFFRQRDLLFVVAFNNYHVLSTFLLTTSTAPLSQSHFISTPRGFCDQTKYKEKNKKEKRKRKMKESPLYTLLFPFSLALALA